MPCGWPSVLAKLITSGWVDSQYTLRSTSAPCWRSCSSTKYTRVGEQAGTFGFSTPVRTCWLASVKLLLAWSSSTFPARL